MNINRKCSGNFRYFLRLLSSARWTPPASGHDTNIKIYNCIVRKKVPLILKNKYLATWYSCGPTVYGSAHIGHASCYVKQDILQRILRDYFHLNVITAMNITDIDDKIISRSSQSGEHWKDLAKRYETEFWDDLNNLGVCEPDIKCRATDFIPKIIEFIGKLVDSKSAYTTTDGSVYFNVSQYPNYGKLQNISTETESTQSTDNHKKSPADFALWKAAKSNEPSWMTPWGPGRPGWHIECSTMASSLFGQSIDFHSGGLDLRFPHHENEEAQSCSYHKTDQWVNYWIHTGHLHVQGHLDKMSKSLNNTISIQEMLNKYEADQFRMACLLSNWQNRMDFGSEIMDGASSVLKRFKDFHNNINAFLKGLKPQVSINSVDIYNELEQTIISIDESLKDNFNTAQSIDALHTLVTFVNRAMTTTNQSLYQSTDFGVLISVDKFLLKFLNILGIQLDRLDVKNISKNTSFNCEKFIDDILLIRNDIRGTAVATKNQKLFQHCDQIRNSLKSCGIDVKDHGKQSSWNFSTIKK